MRGAANAALALSPEKRAKGLATHSSGNFAQAVALTARMLGVPAYIVCRKMPPRSKKTPCGVMEPLSSNVNPPRRRGKRP